MLRTRSGALPLDRVVLVGILNATPDSFSDGGVHLDPARAAAAAAEMVAAGARMLDVGAESTRPGAVPVPAEEERRRLLPVLRAVRDAVGVPISVDTTKADVARRALEAGADLVNDVSAGRFDPGMLPLCAASGVPVVLMHMQGTPATMQQDPRYTDVVTEVTEFLAERAQAAAEAGVAPDAIVVDPGIGFGKTVEHNCRLLRRLDLIAALGYPILVGVSRKGFIGGLLGGRGAEARLHGTAAAVALAVAGGARLLRVHDVAAMRDVVAVAEAVAGA
ncbi:MAG TPA: dihydropteroate synthase [Candidatus Binatus sp.]|nr:dihydropteroate synthase [Candidatus Binatus sp.]